VSDFTGAKGNCKAYSHKGVRLPLEFFDDLIDHFGADMAIFGELPAPFG
jgi:hypothetical protein